jgi:AraC-like DNA-binding protein
MGEQRNVGLRRQWSVPLHDADLHVSALHAHFTTHAFAPHWHDYYVIGLITDGVQTFRYRRESYVTTQGGFFLLNPGEPHTGEAAIETGFTYRALYPTNEHMEQVTRELRRPGALPHFPTARVDARDAAATIHHFHALLSSERSVLERQTRWLSLLTTLVLRYGSSGSARLALPAVGAEPRAVALARDYLEDHYAERVTLPQLAAQTSLSPYHLVRVFRRATGITPHAYLESVRIRHAQRRLERGDAPVDVALATGFSSQSHFTERFRRTLGVTPAVYAGLWS